MLCHPRSLVKTARVFEAHLAIVEHKNIICAGFKAVLHIHTCVEEVTITVRHSHYADLVVRRSRRLPPALMPPVLPPRPFLCSLSVPVTSALPARVFSLPFPCAHAQALLHSIDKKTGKKTKTPPNFVKQGQAVIARLETDGLICIERYEDYQQLGRFILRDEGKTVAMGKVLKLVEIDPATLAAASAAAAPGAAPTSSPAGAAAGGSA